MRLLGVAFSSLEDLSNSRRTSISLHMKEHVVQKRHAAHERECGTEETCAHN